MADSTVPSRERNESGIRLDVLGVRYFWPHGPDVRFDKDNLEEGRAAGQRLRAAVEDPMRRQHREYIEYWDAMTYLETTRLPQPLAASTEARLADSLIWMLGREQIHEKTVVELTELPIVEHSRTRLRGYGQGLSDPIFALYPRAGPRPKIGHVHDSTAPTGIYRTIEVDMAASEVDPGTIDWDRLHVQSVLLQIHADLDIYYETGFQRVRKCQRRLCGAWFCASRMDGRGRFCSATCRVASGREESRLTRRERKS